MKIWTNGCFDVLHRGHVELFRFARSLGDELIVGIDTDEKVKKDKGKFRPINTMRDRKFILESIKYIDKVITFNSTQGLEDTIETILPNIMVIGSDWKGKTVIGQQYTDELIFFDRIGDYSTTNILNGKTDNI